METLRRRFSVAVGYSDHTLGDAVALAAVALGAELLEKHLTLDRSMAGPDHAASMEPGPFGRLVVGVRAVAARSATGARWCSTRSARTQQVARQEPLRRARPRPRRRARGERCRARRPGTGISPARLPSLVGRRIRRAVVQGAMLREDDLE